MTISSKGLKIMKSKIIYDNYTIYENGDIYNKYNKKMVSVDNGRGYLSLGLQIEPKGKRVYKAVHRLLAEAFIPNPNNYSDVNHIDGNRRNNNLSNLEWCTHGENIQHSYNLKNRSALGENNARCKTNESIVHEICKHLENKSKPSFIRNLGYDYSLIRSIKRRQTWKHISNNYNF